MKAILFALCLAILTGSGAANAYQVIFDSGVKNRTCARASLGLVQSYLKKMHNGLRGQTILKELRTSASYLLVIETLGTQNSLVQVHVQDMAGEDGTCTATHIKFADGRWIDLQKMAYSQAYPRN